MASLRCFAPGRKRKGWREREGWRERKGWREREGWRERRRREKQELADGFITYQRIKGFRSRS